MSTIPIKNIWIDVEMRTALREYAYQNRTSMGEIVRAAAADVRDNPLDESVLSEDDCQSKVRLNVKITDELWEAAKDSAHDAGSSLNSLIRRRIRKSLKESGLL